MAKPNAGNRDFAEIVSRVDGLWVGELDPSHIKLVEDDVINRQEELKSRAKELEKKLSSDLKREYVSDLENDHNEFRHTQYEYERLEHVRKGLYNKRQRRIIWHGLRNKLGKTRAVKLEKLVLGLIVIVLLILLAEMILGSALSTRVLLILYAIDFSACMVFLYEFSLRYREAEDKSWFWKHNWIDLVSSLPIPPVMPTADLTTLARFARLFRILRLLRAVRIVALLWSGMEKMDRVADVRMMKRSLASVGVLMILGAFLVQLSEGVQMDKAARHTTATVELADTNAPVMANFSNYPETIWWTFNTIATGSFADLYKPEKPFTRLVTALLILGGFVVLGVFIATLSAAFRGEDVQEMRRNQRQLKETLSSMRITQQEIDRRLAQIRKMLPVGR